MLRYLVCLLAKLGGIWVAEPSGIEKMVGDAVAGTRGGAVEGGAVGGDQAEFDLSASEDHLGLPDAGDIIAIQAERGGSVADAVDHWRRNGRKGRKPGAKNRATDDLAKYLRQFGPDPAVAMMRFLGRPVDMLAAELGCKGIEAAELQRKIAAELMPYLYGKKPVSIDFQGKGHMTLVLGEVAQAASAGQAGDQDGDAALAISYGDPSETAENGGFSGGDREQSE